MNSLIHLVEYSSLNPKR